MINLVESWPLVCLKAAHRKKQRERGPLPGTEKRGDYTEEQKNNVIMPKASANTPPKIAQGLVTNIWLESTLYSVKSGEILVGINSPFVACFHKS